MSNVNENPSAARPVYTPTWVHEMRPSAERAILDLDSTATLSAVGENESEQFYREMYTGHLWSQTKKKKIPCQFHVFYVQYKHETAFHVTIHLNQKNN